MDSYYGWLGQAIYPLATAPTLIFLYPSAVEVRCRLRMKSRTADRAYRTARPILMKRGPVPLSRDVGNQDDETPSSLATWAECSRGSISLVFAGAFMAHLLSLLEMDEDAPEASAKITLCYAKFLVIESQ